MLASFFGSTKLILGTISGFVVTIFLLVFKARGKEIEEQQEEIRELKRQEEVNSKVIQVSEEIREEYLAEENEIEETYNEREGFVYKTSDKPLTPTLLSKLRGIQGLQNSSDEYPK